MLKTRYMNVLSPRFQKHDTQRGFSVVELLIVIITISILSAIVIVTYSSARTKAIDKQLMSDLDKASDQLEIDFLDNKQYPATLAASNGGKGVDSTKGTVFNLYAVSATGKEYCLNASAPGASGSYNVTQDGNVKSGTCTAP